MGGGIPTDTRYARYTGGSSRANNSYTWTVVSLQPNTDTIWMKTGINCSSQRAELSKSLDFQLFYIDSWAVLKGLTLWIAQWETEG